MNELYTLFLRSRPTYILCVCIYIYVYVYRYTYIYVHFHVHICVLVTQSRLTLCDPMGTNQPESSVYGVLPKESGVGCHSLLQQIFQTQGSNLGFLPRWILCRLSHQGNSIHICIKKN